MDILFPKLLRQALRQRSQTKLPSSEHTRRRVPPQAGSRAGENQSPSFPLRLVNLILLECQDRLA